ncbi:putative ribonuclease H-like domain-containing protein, partial [Tanacetum coccineum]
EFQQPKFEGYGPKTSKSVSEDTSNEVRESLDASLVKELVSNYKLKKKTIFPTVAKINFVRPQQQEKPVRKLVNFDHVQANCNYHQKERMVSENNYTRVNYNYSAKKAHPSAHRNIVLRAVLMKTGLRPLNTARPVNTAHPKTTVYSARPMSCFSKSTQSTVKRPYQIKTALTNKNFSQKVNTSKESFYTARPKAVNTARPNSAVVNAVKENQGHPQKEDQGYVDSGCLRHMTGNMSYLLDFKEFDGGYVAFRGGAKGGRITGKGTLKTGKLDFEDVYFVKELQFNLFSVSHMCDKKKSVLFIDTGCFIPSLDFKLADESQVLLKVPRKNNIYIVDMKNIVPKESLTCLVAKATLDESMLWHRRLGHVNFKTINKLVKDNLMNGLPIKRFENDQTCVACLKGKQHKASYDIIFGSTKKELCTDFEKLMHKIFQISSMGELTFFLGLQVTQKADGIFISQDKYVDEILKKFGFSTVKTASTPMETSKPLLKDAEAEDVDVYLYRSMIRSLMYLTASRHDIMFAVCACARFQVTPKVSHLHAMKKTFRYLKGKPKLCLWYPKDSAFDFEAYTNSDYAGASLDMKSTTGGCQFLGRRLISWQCKRKTIVANSTTEVEYVAAGNCRGQVLWIQNQMLNYGNNFMNTKIQFDNESTICIFKNPVFHSKTKHIEIRHHNVADLLIKAFDVGRFQYLIASIRMLNP